MRISDWSSDGCSSDLHETGTRDIRRLSGLGRIMPTTAILATVAAAAMAGVPLLNGFLSKEMFFAEDRKSVVSGKSVSVRVDLGGRSNIKIKIKRYENEQEEQYT